jgi:ubiquinone biosynthesis protein COQ9
MNENEFDAELVGAALKLAAEKGWRAVSPAAAARRAGLDLTRARQRFPGTAAILLRLGAMADQTAVESATLDGPVRDRLFDMLMRRIDVFQMHRAGVLALLRALPRDPCLALLLGAATRGSMRWLLQAAGFGTAGPRGEIRIKGMVAIWLWTLRAWQKDESADLSRTMAALDNALRRAEEWALWIRGQTGRRGADTASAEPESFGEASASGTEPFPNPTLGDVGPGAAPPAAPRTEPPSEPPHPEGPAPLPPAA